jgi:hypothetical protein
VTPGEALTELRRLADRYKSGEITEDEWADAGMLILSQVEAE